MSIPSFSQRPASAFIAAALACVTLAACDSNRQQLADTAAAMSMASPASDTASDTAAAPKPSDAQIAQIVLTANSNDSTISELALTKGQSKSVKDFAQTMVTDHSQVNKQAVALATKLGVTPEASDVSQQLKASGAETLTSLQGMTGAAFDKAYIDHEVSYHQAVLDALDKTLIPNAQNGELKALLTKASPIFTAHLQRAKRIQSSLGA